MKKLKLKALELGAADVLTRAQLKNVLGGDEGSGEAGQCGTACSGSCILKGGPCDGRTGTCSKNSTGKCFCSGAC